jgi:hypothetical protein
MHDDLGRQTIYIKAGACGHPAEDHTWATISTYKQVGGANNGAAAFNITFAADASVIEWIKRQLSGGKQASLYVSLIVENTEWYSSEAALTTPAAPQMTPPAAAVTPVTRPAEKFCINCGASIPQTSTSCPVCGSTQL